MLSDNPTTLTIEVIAVIVVMMIVRLRRVVYGAKISSVASIFYSLWYIVFGALVATGSYYSGVPPLFFMGYAGLAIASTFVSYLYSGTTLVFWKSTSDGSIYFKGGLLLQLIYIIGFIIRVTLAYFFVGIQYLFYIGGAAPPIMLTGASLAAIVASDLLVILGSGLRLGRTFRTYAVFRQIKSGRMDLLSQQS